MTLRTVPIGRALCLVPLLLAAACATTSKRDEGWSTAVTAPSATAVTPAPVPRTPDSSGDQQSGDATAADGQTRALAQAQSASSQSSASAAAAPQTLAGLTPSQYPDLFDRMRAGFSLPNYEDRAIDTQLNWYAGNPAYLERVFDRAGLYLHHITAEVEARGMPTEIALLPVVESAFEPFAYSRSSASGLWQFISDTGRRFGLRQTWWYDGRRDVLESTRAALDYLQYMHDEFNGDWLLAVAGYNCGENCVARAVRATQAAGQPVDFWSVRSRLPQETRAYVPKLLAMKRLLASPEDYGIEFSSIPNEPYFALVNTKSQIDLKVAAKLAGITLAELSELNPAFHRWATPPDGPFQLLLPIDAADQFRESIAKLSPEDLMPVIHHTVKAHETLASIAHRYNTQPHVVRELNELGNGALVVGTDLRLPSGNTELPEKVARAAARVDRRSAGNRDSRRNARRPNIHVVRRGDTLWAVARRHKMNVSTLMRLNGISPGQSLHAGDRLVIARTTAVPARSRTAGAATAAGTASKSTGAVRHHTVRRGDTLSSIARRHKVSVAQLAAWNGLSLAAALRIGQELMLKTSSR